MKIGFKKSKMLEIIDTPYFTKLDNDIIVYPGALEAEVEALESNLDLAACSGMTLQEGRLNRFIGVAHFKKIGIYLMKLRPLTTDIMQKKLYYADLIPEGHTTFRTKAFKYLSFDPTYDLGYSHWDIAVQIWKSPWKCAVRTDAFFDHRHRESPPAYNQFHDIERMKILRESRRLFIEKWGLHPVEYNERTVPGMILHLANTLGEKLRGLR
jgi:hypothetical protein